MGQNKVLDERAQVVLVWGLDLLAKGTFSRGDYKLLLIVTMVWLGGKEVVESFMFPVAGAHHFAR